MSTTQWGSFGDEVFTTTYTPYAFSDERKWKLQKHGLINGYPGHEYQGEDERTLKIDLKLHRKFTNCQEAYRRLVTVADSGQAKALTIGTNLLGDFAIRIISRTINSTSTRGEQIEVTLAVTLVEIRNV